MEHLTIDWVRNNNLLVFEAITGSKAYGLDTAASDTDIRGVFVLPKEMFYSLDYVPQVSNESNDIVYYELKRFVELLAKNNPNMLEMLSMPEQCILQKDEIISRLQPDMFLSKLCEKSFANYAFSQVKKAYGLEKKILNPVEEERKQVLDFCYVYTGKETSPAKEFLMQKGYGQHQMGLSAIAHLRDCYNLYYSSEIQYAGVVRKEESNDVALSNIPKGEQPVGMLYFNKDGYSVYCKKYKEYWEWVEKRNDERYNTTMQHGGNYDSKNMMHVFRLLQMGKEIATENKINVGRTDREFLLDIKKGKFLYDDLLQRAEALKAELPQLYQQSQLPDEPDIKAINGLLVQMRKEYYKE